MLEPETFETLRPAAMVLAEARCIHCELCYDIAPVIRGNEARIPVTHNTLEAMAACPTGAIVWCEDPDEWDAVDEASWESFPASDAPGWWGRPQPGALKQTQARNGHRSKKEKQEREEPS